MSADLPRVDPWNIVKSACLVAVVAILCIKIYVTPTTLTVDFPTLLSLLLAVFAIALAALFYFKATETSNAFYDNTYKFTRDVAQLLAKMESGFGERLRHLDEGYSSLRDSFQGGDRRSAGDNVESTKQKLEEEQREVRKAIEDRNRIVRDLIEQSHLQEEQKEQVTQLLKAKEKDLELAQQEVAKLNRRLMVERIRRHGDPVEAVSANRGMNSYTRSHVIRRLGLTEVLEAPANELRVAFGRLGDELPRGYIHDMEELGFYDGTLTQRGVDYLRSVARAQDE